MSAHPPTRPPPASTGTLRPTGAAMSRLPDFVIVGAARCGTSSLHAYLREHPQVCMSRDKEPDYFSLGDLPAAEIPRNGSPYRALTLRDYERQFEAAGNARAVGEASPTYLVWPRSVERMRALIPDAKLICILRDPVERAYSHYAFARKMGAERCQDFEQAIVAEEARAREDPTLCFTYVRGSLYHDGLRAYFERFPRERILVLLFEEFARDPAGTMRRIHRFIGVDEHFLADVGVRHNRSLMPRQCGLVARGAPARAKACAGSC